MHFHPNVSEQKLVCVEDSSDTKQWWRQLSNLQHEVGLSVQLPIRLSVVNRFTRLWLNLQIRLNKSFKFVAIFICVPIRLKIKVVFHCGKLCLRWSKFWMLPLMFTSCYATEIWKSFIDRHTSFRSAMPPWVQFFCNHSQFRVQMKTKCYKLPCYRTCWCQTSNSLKKKFEHLWNKC